MKKHIFVPLALSVMAASLVFVGCSASKSQTTAPSYGSASSSYSATDMSAPEAGNASGEATDLDAPANNADKSVSLIATDRKLIKSASFNIESKDLSASITTLEAAIATGKGYIERSSTYGDPKASGSTASYTARIPITEYEGFKQALQSVGNIFRSTEGSEDVTDQYFDVEARLSTLRVQEQRLLKMLETAGDLEDLITLEEKLSSVRYEIEKLTTNIRKYDNLIDYTTIEIELQQKSDYTPVKADTFLDRIGEAFSGSTQSVVDFAQGSLIVIIWVLPYILIIGIIIVAAIAISRAVSKHRRNNPRLTPPRPPYQPTGQMGMQNQQQAPPPQNPVPPNNDKKPN